jgi:hypothetical protein
LGSITIRDHRETRWIVDYELLLNDTINPIRLQDLLRLKAIIEDAESTTENGFGRTRPATNTPCKPQARRPVSAIVNIILSFETQAVTERDIRAHAPIVLYVETAVIRREINVGLAGGY